MPSLEHQLLAVSNAARDFADWNFDSEIPIERRDESGALAFTLNRLATFYRPLAVLSNKTFADFIRTGTMPAIHQNKETVALVANIRSFSQVTRGLRPREKLELANTFFERVDLCARLTGGYVDKYIGDKVIVHWGMFSGGGLRDNALAAIRAVLMIRAYLGDWNRERIGAGLSPLLFSFGIDAGTASLSSFSIAGVQEYSITGPVVNNAYHCEASTKKTGTEILLTETVYHLVERFVVAGEITRDAVAPDQTARQNRLFTLINVREKKVTRLLLKDLARIAGIDLAFALTLAGPRGPKTRAELRAALHNG
jgi:adenylate cyclase